MLGNKWNDQRELEQWKNAFLQSKPFRFLVIDDAIDPETAGRLAAGFPSLEQMDVNYKGMNEKKSEHSSFDLLDPIFSQLRDELSGKEFLKKIEFLTGIKDIFPLPDRYGYGLHQGGNGSFLDIHVDYNLHPVRKKHRRLNLILFLNPAWQAEWGGALEFWDQDVSTCRHAIAPVFNRMVLFECNEISFHGYSTITCPTHTTRKSFYQYYFTDPDQKMVFHDTIFKPKQKEKLGRKIRITAKEKTKNLIKRTLYHLGLNRLLK